MNEFQILYDTIYESLQKDINLEYTDEDSGLISFGKNIKFINIQKIMNDLNIDNSNDFYSIVSNKFTSIIDNYSKLIRDKDLVQIVYENEFKDFINDEIFDKNSFFIDKIKNLLKIFYDQPDVFFVHFIQSYELDIPENIVDLYWDNIKKKNCEDYSYEEMFHPYFNYENVIIDYDNLDEIHISFEECIKRFILKSQIYYTFISWLKEKSFELMV